MLNRQAFISQLGKRAEKAGVKIKTNAKINSIEELAADYIVDASGCPSIIKRKLGFKKGVLGYTYQQTLQNSNFFNKKKMEISLTADTGYFWIFPRNPKINEINLGVGVIAKKPGNLKNRLEKFKQKENITGEINYETGGLIPAGIQKPLVYKNILFVGDAGVGTFPLTGEGIYRALLSGEAAGKAMLKDDIISYKKTINRYFLKWDILGKNFLNLNKIFGEISDDAVFFLWHLYLDWWYSFN